MADQPPETPEALARRILAECTGFQRDTLGRVCGIDVDEQLAAALIAQHTAELTARNQELTTALSKINEIRNSIVGYQSVNFSAHIYPLVAALNEAGFKGEGYEEARAKAQTQVERIASLEAQLAASAQREASARAEALREAEAAIAELTAGNETTDVTLGHEIGLCRAQKAIRKLLTSPPPPRVSVRPVVLWFAEQMEAKLRENDHKGGWHNDRPHALLERVWQEAGEVEQALRRGHYTDVIREAADVANMVMMVADHYRVGGPSRDSGKTVTPPALGPAAGTEGSDHG